MLSRHDFLSPEAIAVSDRISRGNGDKLLHFTRDYGIIQARQSFFFFSYARYRFPSLRGGPMNPGLSRAEIRSATRSCPFPDTSLLTTSPPFFLLNPSPSFHEHGGYITSDLFPTAQRAWIHDLRPLWKWKYRSSLFRKDCELEVSRDEIFRNLHRACALSCASVYRQLLAGTSMTGAIFLVCLCSTLPAYLV